MRRVIEGFRQDDEGDWVAELSCLHSQHVRHRPPFQQRRWVLNEEGRRSRIGQPLDCPLCDRAELPGDLRVVRTAGPFDADTLPAGLRRDHEVGEHTWGLLHVREGSVRFTLETSPPVDRELTDGDVQAIPPGVLHAVHNYGAHFRLEVDFLTR